MHKIEFIVLCNRKLDERQLDKIIAITKDNIIDAVQLTLGDFTGKVVPAILTDEKYYNS